MRARCPTCDSAWIGFPIPDGACVVRVDGSLGEITLARAGTGRFLDFDDVDQKHAVCLDCSARFNANAKERARA